ncbi:uncharacterized protein LOC120928459 [Rana temporaria]|uniref:uncharacterized protein LOC120928459 n=1 Tax=Rana temporaria TaxID=8407 RepID=UPI001AAD755E|nr:uncharacterized protein LOC120928459 [Rana temporaria]
MLKTKWKSIRDAFTRHLRVQRERRSGSSACAPKDYIYSKELEFLRPLLALGSTENCWEEAAPTAPVDTDNASLASGDQALAGQEPESQLSTSSRSTSATPVGDDESTPTVFPRGPARGTRREAPAPEPDFNRMLLDIMSNMSDRMSSNRSYGQMSARCLGKLMDRVPKNLQADMLAGTIRNIATFIPPTEPYQSSEPPPPYGPYATHPPAVSVSTTPSSFVSTTYSHPPTSINTTLYLPSSDDNTFSLPSSAHTTFHLPSSEDNNTFCLPSSADTTFYLPSSDDNNTFCIPSSADTTFYLPSSDDDDNFLGQIHVAQRIL